MAEAAVYQRLGPPLKVHDGNAFICAYNSEGGPLRAASLTTYAGKAALAEDTSFYHLVPVPGIGDSAALDIDVQLISVSVDDLNIVISLATGRICEDILNSPALKAACWEDIKSRLIGLARTVLEAR